MVSKIPSPSIGIDLDGTIDEAPIFFNILTHQWPGNVYIITYRNDMNKAIARLKEFDIKYDQVILVRSFKEKAEVISQLGVLVYFDDQDEMLSDIAPQVNVFKFRNGGNFDYDTKQWLYSAETGRQI